MTLDDLDQLILSTQRRRADDVVPTGDPVPSVLARVARLRRRRRYDVAAVVATVALAITAGTVLVLNRPGESPAGIAQHPSATPSQTSPPPTQGPPRTRDEALLRQLADNAFVRLQLLGIGPGGFAAPRGQVLCSLHVMGSSHGGSTLYIWLGCGDYVVTNGTAVEASGGDDPAVVEVAGRGAAAEVQSITFPRQASLAADIKRLFPPSIASHLYDEANKRTSPSPAELEKEAVALGRLPGATSSSPAATSPLVHPVKDCSSWLTGGSPLWSAITSAYGDLHDCFALSGVWVLTADPRSGPGFVGVHVCNGSCAGDIPTTLADWTFYQPSTKPGAYERVAGTKPDGSILFVGSAGEFTFDPRTRTLRPNAR